MEAMKNKKLNILIVEDDAYFRRDISQKLGRYGSVDQADSLDSARQCLDSKPYQVAFIDLNLSGKDDGLDIIKDCRYRDVDPIVLTGYENKETVSYTHLTLPTICSV